MYAASDPKFNADLIKAMTMIRGLRARAYMEKWDGRAVRCALKFAMKVDDHFARGKVSPEDEAAIEAIAEQNFKTILARERAVKP